MRFVLAIGVMGALAFGCAPEPVAKAVEVQTSKLEKGTNLKEGLDAFTEKRPPKWRLSKL